MFGGPLGAASLCLALAIMQVPLALAETPQSRPHVHGNASIFLVLEEKTLTIEFTAPLHDLAGFEHAPKSAADKKVLAQLREALGKPQAVVSVPASAGCTTRDVMIEGMGIDRDAHGHDDERHHGQDHHHHADVIATYTLACTALKSLRTVNVRAPMTFPSITSVDVTVLGPGTQFARKLTQANSVLRLRQE